ncbi:MAG: hypothetical protein DHS20C18_00020 [Saprospiraceae bacterium]|nr:MAG: hypothetical protein DHS20C18_00020 [Saprospiraceae bacterium]
MQTNKDIVNLLNKAQQSGITVFKEEQKLKFKVAKNTKVDPAIVDLLKAHKQKILAFLGDEIGAVNTIRGQEEQISVFDRKNVDQIPLSFTQERLWFIDRLSGSSHYHIPFMKGFGEDLHVETLEYALKTLINRHEVLRTVILEKEGSAFQQVLPKDKWYLHCLEIEDSETEATLNNWITQEISRPFDLAADHMLRATLIKKMDGQYLLVIVIHHIASDGWSMNVMTRELQELYQSKMEGRAPALKPLTIQYADYAFWQRNDLIGTKLEEKLAFWEHHLKGVTPLSLPLDFARPRMQSFKGASISFGIDKETTKQLNNLCQTEEVTLFMLLLTAFKVLLYRYSGGQEDICVGSPIANRSQKALEDLIGFFVNTIALRSHLSEEQSFTELLHRVKTTTLDAYKHQDTPFEKVVDRITIKRDNSMNPLFQVAFVLQNVLDISQTAVQPINKEEKPSNYQISKFDLTMSAAETQQGLLVNIEYCTDLFKASSISQMASHFQQLLSAIIQTPQASIGTLNLLSDTERKTLLTDFNATEAPYPADEAIVAQLKKQVEKNPDNPALIFQNQTLTFRQFDEQSNQLAQYLIKKGVQSNDCVGLLAYRGFDMIIGIFGILKCGATYVPLNIDYPRQRLEFILEDAGIDKIVITGQEILDQSGLTGYECLKVSDAAKSPKTAPDRALSVHTPAYVMYTSGTTGTPKGTLVNQKNILKLAYEQEGIAIYPEDRVLQWSNYAFDGSTYDIYNALLNGACLCLITEADVSNADRLSEIIQEKNVTVSFFTSALFNSLVDYAPAALKGMRKVLFGGEAASAVHVRKALEMLGPDRVVNGYGPTETTTFATFYSVRNADNKYIPIGRPLSNTQVYIVNKSQQLAGIGIPGELWIAGEGVSLGYLNRPDLNNERFIPNPFSGNANGKLYKTGDLARWMPDGNIEFIGRKDDQIKMRGYRIELGEIESILGECPLVQQGVVLLHQDQQGNKRLVAYIAPTKKGLDKSEIQSFLSLELPDYMVPSLIVELEALPLTTNGKVDKRALPEPDSAELIGEAYLAPRNEIEIQLVNIWQELLDLPKVGVLDNFFELGGHSLLAIRVTSAIRKSLEIELIVGDIFMYPTIEKLAAFLETNQNTAALPPLIPGPRPARIPLSYSQERLWFIDQFGGSLQYHIPVVYGVNNELEKEVLEKALKTLISRHEILRTVIQSEDGEAYQKIIPADDWTMEYHESPGFNSDADSQVYIEAIVNKPFDLSNDYMLRAHLVKCGEEDQLLILVIHHIASDGWSNGILVKELMALFDNPQGSNTLELPPLSVQYADYAIWQRNHLSGEFLKSQLDWWQQYLAGASPLNLPLDFPRPPIQSTNGAVVGFQIEKPIKDQLNKLSLDHGVSLFMTLLSAFKVLLYRYSEQTDICIGTPTANRNQREVESMVGFFVNTLALRSDLSGNPEFTYLLEQVKTNTLVAFSHQDVPFEQIVECVEKERSLDRNPIFQVMFALQNIPDSPDLELGPAQLSQKSAGRRSAQFDLTFSIVEYASGLLVEIEYCSDLFAESTIQRMAGHFQNLLEAIVINPSMPIGQLTLLNDQERQQLLFEFNNTKNHYPRNKTVIDLFEEQVLNRPNEKALGCEGQVLTYLELNKRANQLAHYLIEKGLKQEDLVALCVDRSLEMIVGILGILKAGSAYIPIDTNYPVDRIEFILEDTKAPFVISKKQLGVLPSKMEGKTCILLDEEVPFLLQAPVENVSVDVRPDHLAYVIYTSGSTGKPKGTLISHQNLMMRLQGEVELLKVNTSLKSCLLTNYVFDVSLLEIFLPLIVGGSLQIPHHNTIFDSDKLIQLLVKEGVTQIQSTPSFLTSIMHAIEGHLASQLKLEMICTGGESLNGDLVKTIRAKLPQVQLNNHYGPTEITIDAIVSENVTAFERNIIGRPIANTAAFIVDTSRELVPVGVIGELLIGGDGVSEGYLNRPELTPEKFIPHPFDPTSSSKVYCTGDLARWLPDGTIEFFGRKDDQVKIRGHRVELGEIEAILAACDLVNQCTVLVKKNTQNAKSLIAYVIPKGAFLKEEIIAYLKPILPDYMIPDLIIELEKFPLNANGKIDKQRLPDPDINALMQDDFVAPSNDTEHQLAIIWKELLGLEKIGIHNNFFELGGHSLMAMRVASAIRKEFDVHLEIRELFLSPTISELAQKIEHLEIGGSLPPIIKVENKPSKIPLSYAQERLWFIDQFEGSVQYHMPTVLRLKKELNKNALEQALLALVERNEILRTVIRSENGITFQEIMPAEYWKLGYTESAGFETDAQLREIITSKVQHPFDLSNDYMLRAHLIACAENDHVLILVMHHIASDGWSFSLLIRDLMELYEAKLNNRNPVLPPLKIQYADYAIWQRAHLNGTVLEDQLQWWEQQLSGLEPLKLPTDFPRPTKQSTTGSNIGFSLEKDMANALNKLSLQTGTTLFMTLLAAFKVLLYRYSGQEDICIGTPVANRNQKEVEGLVGFFVNTLALRTDLSGNPGFLELLKRVKTTSLSAFACQEVPFERIVDRVESKRDLSRTPVFQVMFALQNTPDSPALELGNIDLSFESSGRNTSLYDINLSISENTKGLDIGIDYCTDLFREETIKRMSLHFRQLLQAIIADPNQAIGQINILNREEEHILLQQFNDTQVEFPHHLTVVDLIDQQTRRTPNATAITFEQQRLSYEQLDHKSNQLAHYLRKNGVQTESLVAICLDRSLEMMIGLLGILKAGGAYVPIDPGYPEERINYMLQDTQTQWVITSQNIATSWEQLPEVQVIAIDREWPVISQQPSDKPNVKLDAKDLMYIIYTSGSTGNPKGVMNQHEGVMNRLFWGQQRYALNPEKDVVLQKTTFCFDVSVWELFWPLISGARLVFATPDGQKNSSYLKNIINQENITIIHFVPSMLEVFLLDIQADECPSLQRVFCSGEALKASQAKRFRQLLPDVELHNLYGPTEAAIEVTFWEAVVGKQVPNRIPIGKPTANTQMYILNASGMPSPIGVPGELHIGGIQVARGYWKRPELNAEKFVPDPFGTDPNGRLYKTGDLARWLPDGNIEYLGRIDDQVKIRGFRIELGEIEQVLGQAPDVSACAVLAKADKNNNLRLVAYLVTTNPLDKVQLQAYLLKKLPDYMVPAIWISLPALPLNYNGKLDRKALPNPNITDLSQMEYVAPNTPTAQKLAYIWQDMLGLEKIGIHDHFFELGGHSLITIPTLFRINKELDTQLTLMQFFTNLTIAQLTELIDGKEATRSCGFKLNAIEKGLPNLFFIPPALGLPIVFNELAEGLSGRLNCYGFQYRGWGADEPFDERIEQMAEAFTEEVLSIQQTEEFIICGYSMGGNIAYEMAKILEGLGHQVRLILIDREVANYQDLSTEDIDHQVGLSIDWLYQSLPKESLISIDQNRIHAFLKNNIQLLTQHHVSGEINAPILALEARENRDKPLMKSWEAYTSGSVHHHWIESQHYTILDACHIPHIQQLFLDYLLAPELLKAG